MGRRLNPGTTRQNAFLRFPYGDVIIALALAALVSLSLVGTWSLPVALTCPDLVPAGCTAADPCIDYFAACPQGFPGGSLWEGFGIVPGLLLLAAVMFFVLRRLPRLVRPWASAVGIAVAVTDVAVLLAFGPSPALLIAAALAMFLLVWAFDVRRLTSRGESLVWIGLGAVELGLLLLLKVVGFTDFMSQTFPGAGGVLVPVKVAGWPVWMSVALAAALVVGGAVRFLRPSATAGDAA
ncbi:MAG: hypothetical protein ABSA40_05485 [Candidatus Dormibacteria bacterium]